MVADPLPSPNVALALGWTRNRSEMNRVSSTKAENPSDQENDKPPGVAHGAPNQSDNIPRSWLQVPLFWPSFMSSCIALPLHFS